jgi:hypothetical protein
MALPNTFLVSWWYSPNTKLGIYFNDFGLDSQDYILNASDDGGVDYSNGMGASVEENYHFENLITNHPVENTAAISDHIIAQPRVITVTGIITSLRPLVLFGTLSFTQLGKATELLIDLYETNQGVSLLTGLLYGTSYLRIDNLAVQSLDIPRNNAYGRSSIKFTMVLKQLIITNTNSTITASSFSQASAEDGVDIL